MEPFYNEERVRSLVPRENPGAEVRIEYLRPGQLLTLLDRFPAAWMPLGTVEWHGRQNPLGCDTIKAQRLCEEAARIAGGVVMPPVWFAADVNVEGPEGPGYGMDGFAGLQLPGSFYQIPLPQLKALLVNACRNYFSRGVDLIIMISGHNPPIQMQIMQEAAAEAAMPGKRVLTLMEFETAEEPELRISDHAGDYETSMMLALTDAVRLDANEGLDEPELGIATAQPVMTASAQRGKRYFNSQVRGLVQIAVQAMQELKDNPADFNG